MTYRIYTYFSVIRLLRTSILLGLISSFLLPSSLLCLSPPSPMSNPRDPDVVIVASDDVQIRVRRSLLSQASPVFSDMFTVPQPNSSLDLDAPSDPINLSEPSKTLRLILSLVDSPPNSLLVDSLSDIANLLQAADKYDIKTIQEHAIYSLGQPKFLENESLRVYTIASRYGAHDTAALAARRTLRYPLLHAEYFSELEIVDGATIYRVLRYHKECTAAAVNVATDHSWIRDEYVFFDCPEANLSEDDNNDEEENKGLGNRTMIRANPTKKHKDGYDKFVSVHRWWIKFMDTTKVALSESIHSEAIRDKGRMMEALLSASQCSHCRRRVNSDFSKFLDAFVMEVEARVNQVSLYVPSDPVILWIYTLDLID